MTARRWLLAIACLGLVACTAYLRGSGLFSGDPIKVPHAVHARAKVQCIACHEEIYDAQSLDGKGLPAEAKCLECHKAEKERGNCGFCHTDVRRAAPWPKREQHLQIAHAPHIDRVKEDCARCHARLPDPLRRADRTPTMASCLGCHEHQSDYDQGRCGKCHSDLGRYPLKPIADFSHQGDFVRNHAPSARSAPESCAQCHEQTFCSDCHAQTVSTRIEVKMPESIERDFIHRGDFLSRHTIEAAADPVSCRRCHGSSFCESCHAAQGLTPLAPNPRDPHPPGWSIPASPSFHGPAARRDISACAACHDQGARSVCVQCHKVGGLGGNPHPLGWTDRHPHAEIRSNGMCLICHL